MADRAVVERTFTDYGIEAVVQWGKRGQPQRLAILPGTARKPQLNFRTDTLAEAVHAALQRTTQGAVDNVVHLRTS